MAVKLRRPRQPLNTVRGDCRVFEDAVGRGALDLAGNHAVDRPAGFNRVTIGVVSTDGKVRKTTEGQWTCNQDGKVWASRGECFSNCKKRGLAGPMVVDCLGTERVCLEVKIRFKLDVEVEIYALQWVTTCPAGRAWNKQIRNHEEQHYKDVKERAKAWRGDHSSRNFKACATTEAEALADLRGQIDAEIDSQIKALGDLIDEDQKEFHRSEGGNELQLDCSQCP